MFDFDTALVQIWYIKSAAISTPGAFYQTPV